MDWFPIITTAIVVFSVFVLWRTFWPRRLATTATATTTQNTTQPGTPGATTGQGNQESWFSKLLQGLSGLNNLFWLVLVMGVTEVCLFSLTGTRDVMYDWKDHHPDQFWILNFGIIFVAILSSVNQKGLARITSIILTAALIYSAATTWPFFTGVILAPVGELSQIVEVPRGSIYDCRAVNPKEQDLFVQYHVDMKGDLQESTPGVPSVKATAGRFKSISDHPIRIRCEDVRVR